jgi:hypothetical protein
VALYKKIDGTVFHRSTKNSYVENNWANSSHFNSVGWINPGHWPIDIFIIQYISKAKRLQTGLLG